jgi:hypothetical protein
MSSLILYSEALIAHSLLTCRGRPEPLSGPEDGPMIPHVGAGGQFRCSRVSPGAAYFPQDSALTPSGYALGCRLGLAVRGLRS